MLAATLAASFCADDVVTGTSVVDGTTTDDVCTAAVVDGVSDGVDVTTFCSAEVVGVTGVIVTTACVVGVCWTELSVTTC